MTGRVVKWDPGRAFGFISVTGSPDFYVHSSDVTDRIWEGCAVEFTPGQARGKPRAYQVRRIQEAP